ATPSCRAETGGARLARSPIAYVVSPVNIVPRLRHRPDGGWDRSHLRGRSGRRPGRGRTRRGRLRCTRGGDTPVNEQPSFEEAQRELERIVSELEGGRASLEDAVALWQRGDELYRYCLGKLDSAEGKIEELGRRVEEAQP